MNRGLRLVMSVCALSVSLASCHEKSPKLVGAPPAGPRKTTGNEFQTLSAKVDILFVIDDSGSMSTHQSNLASNIDKFLVGLQANRFIDYHIGVISTSEEEAYAGGGTAPGAGRLTGTTKFIDKSTVRGVDILQKNMLIGTWGSSIERMFSPVKMALTSPAVSGWNAGFYRPDAFLAVVMITDAEEQSDVDYGWPARDPGLFLSPQQFYDFLVDLKKGDKKKVVSYGAIVPLGTPSSACEWDDPSTPHVRLDEFFRISKGIAYSLCDVDYGTKLGNIGSDLVGRIGRSIILDRRPNPETITVKYGTQILDPDIRTGWSFDPERNTVTFGREVVWTDQAPGTQVEIDFKPWEN